jgi:hypothetical protein
MGQSGRMVMFTVYTPNFSVTLMERQCLDGIGNATDAAYLNNVEFLIQLRGKKQGGNRCLPGW